MGIVLTYNKELTKDAPESICKDISERLYDHASLRSSDIVLGEQFALSLSARPNDYSGMCGNDSIFFAWWGRPLYKGKLLNDDMCAEACLDIEQGGIELLLSKTSGHFQLVVYKNCGHRCYIVCDKTSTHPIYYAQTKSVIAFSPEPLTFKAFKGHSLDLSIRPGALFEYMTSGYLWGDGCFYEGVKRLGPGQFACIDKHGLDVKSYWKMTFTPEKEKENSLITSLYESIQEDTDDLPKGKKVLTLSGGYDSRALLGILKEDEDLNTVSYSYGLKNTKETDVDVGEYYANKEGVTHTYHRTSLDDTSRLIEDIKDVILATGGENCLSAFQDAFLGRDFYRELSSNYDYMIRGDEVWGWGDLAVTSDMAFWEARLFNLNEIAQPQKIMSADAYNNGIRYIYGLRQKFIEDCGESNVSANDLKDYLYWRHREARLLQNMAYFRRCHIPHFAPFLLDRTLYVIAKTPSKFRIQKNLFMKMGKNKFPDLFLDNKTISPRMSDINNFHFLYKDKKFRSFVKGALLENGSDLFNNMFDRKLFEPWINNVLEGSSSGVSLSHKKHDLKRMAVSLIEKSQYFKGYMKAFLVKKGMNTFPILDVNYLFRLVVLSLVLQEYEGD